VTDDSADEEDLRSLWEASLPGRSLDELDLGATFRPADLSAGPVDDVVLPTFSIGVGADLGSASDESDLTTLAEPDDGGDPAGGPARSGVAQSTPSNEATLPPEPAEPDDEPPSGGATDPSAKTVHMPPPGSDPVEGVAPPRLGGDGAASPDPTPLYELSEVIGRGGMGVVYRARQSSLDRDVAIKRVRQRSGGEWREKFLAEALVTGRLDHPNVVPVYDLGQTGAGEALLAMKLVDGTSWKRLLHPKAPEEEARARELDLPDHLRILETVCNAVAFAHSRGIAHNDLKPENVMVGGFGEVLVMDWGLATDFGDDPAESKGVVHKSQVRAPFGTPSYMAPEQARGEGERLGPWTDVYLLGAILFELVAGRAPHKGRPGEVLLRAARGVPPELGPDAPDELAAICRRAMARAPEDRYPDVASFRDAVAAYLEHRESTRIASAARALLERSAERTAGDPAEGEVERSRLYGELAEATAGFRQALVLWPENEAARGGEREAHLATGAAALRRGDLGLAAAEADALGADDPDGRALADQVAAARAARDRAERAGRWTRRALAAATAALVAGLSIGVAVVTAARERAEASEADARAAAVEADSARETAMRRLARSLLAQGDTLGLTGRWAEARACYEEARGLLARTGQPTLPADLGLWSAEAGSPGPILDLGHHAGPVAAVAFTPDERTLISVGPEAVQVWALPEGRLARTLETGLGEATVATVSADGRRVAVGSASGRVAVWDLASGEREALLEAHDGAVHALDFCPARPEQLLTGGADRAVRLWDVVAGERLADLHGHEGAVTAVEYSPNGYYAFSGDAAGWLRWWNAKPPASEHFAWFEPVGPAFEALEFAPAREVFAVGCPDSTVRLWVRERSSRRNNFHDYAALDGHAGAVRTVAWAPDGVHLVSGGADGRLIAWKIEIEFEEEEDDRGFNFHLVSRVEGRRVLEAAVPGGAVEALAVAPSGRLAASGDAWGGVRLWRLGLDRFTADPARVGRALRELAPEGDAGAVSAAVSPDGALAAVGMDDGPVVLWDVPTARRLLTLEGHAGPVVDLRFLDDERLLSLDAAGTARVWDLVSGLPVRSVESGLAGGRAAAVFAAEGLLVLGGPDGTLRAWPLAEPGPAATLGALGVPATVVAAAGGAVLAGGPGGALELIGLDDGATRRALAGHRAELTSLAVAPDGRRALSGDSAGAVRIWELESGRSLGALPGHAGAVARVVFAPGGRLAWSVGADETVRVWDLEALAEVRSFRHHEAPVTALGLGGPDGRLVVTAGRDGAATLYDLGRPRRARELALPLAEARRRLAEDPEDPDALAVVGARYAHVGAAGAATELLLRARAGGAPVSPLELARLHWERGFVAAARDELARAEDEGFLPPAAGARLRERLAREEAESGSLLGRQVERVQAVAFGPAGRRVVSGGSEGVVTLWDAETGLALRPLRGLEQRVYAVAFAPDGERVAAGGREGLLRVWHAATGDPLLELTPPDDDRPEAIYEVAFPDPDRVAAVGYDGVLRLWDAVTGELLLACENEDPVGALAVSPDGDRIAVCAREVVNVWDLASGERVGSWAAETNELAWVAPGRLLAAPDRSLDVWDPTTGEQVASFTGENRRSVYGLGATADRAVTADGDGRAVVWDLATGEPRVDHVDPFVLLAADLAPDGRRYVVGAADGRIVLRRIGGR